jgi:hypothetical protein
VSDEPKPVVDTLNSALNEYVSWTGEPQLVSQISEKPQQKRHAAKCSYPKVGGTLLAKRRTEQEG